jgi:hypothetical protein
MSLAELQKKYDDMKYFKNNIPNDKTYKLLLNTSDFSQTIAFKDLTLLDANTYYVSLAEDFYDRYGNKKFRNDYSNEFTIKFTIEFIPTLFPNNSVILYNTLLNKKQRMDYKLITYYKVFNKIIKGEQIQKYGNVEKVFMKRYISAFKSAYNEIRENLFNTEFWNKMKINPHNNQELKKMVNGIYIPKTKDLIERYIINEGLIKEMYEDKYKDEYNKTMQLYESLKSVSVEESKSDNQPDYSQITQEINKNIGDIIAICDKIIEQQKS